jgi:hypothetical protein
MRVLRLQLTVRKIMVPIATISLRDGMPAMHYRLEWGRGNRGRLRDARAECQNDAAQIIWEAFGWRR